MELARPMAMSRYRPKDEYKMACFILGTYMHPVELSKMDSVKTNKVD